MAFGSASKLTTITSRFLAAPDGRVLSGKEMSYNSYIDTVAGWQIVCDFEVTACAVKVRVSLICRRVPGKTNSPAHSALSAIRGSTFVALSAGTRQASSATAANSTAMTVKVAGSVALTP